MCFEQVYNEYYMKVFHYVKKHISSHHNAEDLTQEIFTACYRSFDSFDPQKASVSTWVFVVMKNRLKNYYRDQKVHVSLDDDESFLNLPGDTDVEQAVLLEREREELMAALDRLSERERTIVMERYFYDKSSPEIARMLNMTDSNVRVTLKRSLEKLRKYLT